MLHAGERLVWIENTARVQSCPLPGCSPITSGVVIAAWSIAADECAAYWIESLDDGGTGRLKRCALPACVQVDTLSAPVSRPAETLQLGRDHVFFMATNDAGRNVVLRVPR